jgi:hypothetical protein
MGAIKIGRIDMVYAADDNFSQKGDRSIDVSRRPPNQFVSISPGELHCAIAMRFKVIDVPGSVKLPPSVVCAIIVSLL